MVQGSLIELCIIVFLVYTRNSAQLLRADNFSFPRDANEIEDVCAQAYTQAALYPGNLVPSACVTLFQHNGNDDVPGEYRVTAIV